MSTCTTTQTPTTWCRSRCRQCVFAAQAFGADPSSLSLPPTMTVGSTWNTVWDLDASVAPADNVGGASVRVHSGVRVLLSEVDKEAVCP